MVCPLFRIEQSKNSQRTIENSIVDTDKHWFVMRDLKRPNALYPAYRQLPELGVETYTPLRQRVVKRGGVSVREYCPFIPDLVFIHSTREATDDLLVGIPTLQYRYVRGGYRLPMTVSDREMNAFMLAVRSVDAPEYFRPEELTPDMIGREVRIVGGSLDGYEGRLLKCRGSRRRRLLVAIPNLLVAAVEVSPDYIVFL